MWYNFAADDQQHRTQLDGDPIEKSGWFEGDIAGGSAQDISEIKHKTSGVDDHQNTDKVYIKKIT